MKFINTAIAIAVWALHVSSAAAAPAQEAPVTALNKRVDCVANAAIIRKWEEDALQRYRVAFSVTRPDVTSDVLGDSCQYFDDQISKCGGINNNIACYHSSADQSWVIDNNQLIGSGDPIEDCLIAAFRDKLAGQWGCHL